MIYCRGFPEFTPLLPFVCALFWYSYCLWTSSINSVKMAYLAEGRVVVFWRRITMTSLGYQRVVNEVPTGFVKIPLPLSFPLSALITIAHVFLSLASCWLIGRLSEGQRIYTTTEAGRVSACVWLEIIIHGEPRDMKKAPKLIPCPTLTAAGPNESFLVFVINIKMFRSAPFAGRVGSPHYMAPEVIANRTYGKPCDVWAAGVMVHLLLSGRLPFMGSGKRLQDVMSRGRISVRLAPSSRWTI